jgi:hypothetical protein
MYKEIEGQIDALVQKSNKDLKTRIMRLITRQTNKILKDHERQFKNKSSSSREKKQVKTSHTKNKPKKKYSDSESDSDGYYSK